MIERRYCGWVLFTKFQKPFSCDNVHVSNISQFEIKSKKYFGVDDPNLRQSKTDQEKRGKVLDIDYGRHEFTCPVRTVRTWIEAAQLTSGRLFRHIKKGGRLEHVRDELNDRALFYILQRYVEQAKLTGKKLTPHSFRATFATLLSANGVDGLEIQKGGRWRDYDTMSGYVRKGKEFKSEWLKRLGF